MSDYVFTRFLRQCRRIVRRVRAGVGPWRDLARSLWAAHVARLIDDPVYAMAAVAVVAGVVGLLPPHDVLAIVAAAVVERYRAGDPGDRPWDGGDVA